MLDVPLVLAMRAALFFYVSMLWMLVFIQGHAQSSLRTLRLLPGQSCVGDSLNLMPGTLVTGPKPGLLSPASQDWTLDLANNQWCLPRELKDTLWVSFRVLPFRLYDTLRDPYWNPVPVDSNPFPDFRILNQPEPDLVDRLMGNNGQLRKSGSLTRGVAFGSATDATLLSSFNLQLSGMLNEDIGIEAAITDENIPVQPDGNTRQLQDFDQIYVRLHKDEHSLTAGDFWLNPLPGYFLVLRKRGQGLMASTKIPNRLLGKSWPQGAQEVRAAGAVSRGKFRRQEFQGQEGNLGPYRLNGNDGESFIIILSGSEAVYVDGQKMTRGQDYDYIIDYNTAELQFTSKRMITKDNRIVVEFEYADRRYQRWMVQAGHAWDLGSVRTSLQFFTEFDDGNSPVNTSLSEEDKALLAAAGDSSLQALSSTADSVGYSPDELRYKKVDSLVNGTSYPIFVISTDPQTALWRVRFSYVGPGNGDYEPVATESNGRVYGWVAPNSDGSSTGSYAPVEPLVAPRLQQMLVLGAQSTQGPWRWKVEAALSHFDQNRFSDLDAADNQGYAYRLELSRPIALTKLWGDSLILEPSLGMEQVDRHFRPFIRFRSVEFERDWNLVNRNNPNQVLERQLEGIDYLPQAGIRLKNGAQELSYQMHLYEKGNSFSGLRQKAALKFMPKGWSLDWQGSSTRTQDQVWEGLFLRQNWALTKSWKFFALGAKGENEVNPQRLLNSDSLLASSYTFHDVEGWFGSGDSSRLSWRMFYRWRLDELPDATELREASVAHHAGMQAAIKGAKGNRLDLTVTWRELNILDSSLTNVQAASNILTRADYQASWFKQAIKLDLFYETGAGLENQRDYQFIPSLNGLGDFVWIDYNNDGLQARDEFEPRSGTVTGTDGLSYVRVWLPTNEYVRAWFNRFTGQLNLRSPAAWKKKESAWWKRALHRASSQTVFRTDRKTATDLPTEVLNPLPPDIRDTNLLSIQYQFRQSLYWNRFGGDLSLEYTWQEQMRQSLLSGGRELQSQAGHLGRVRWSFHKYWTLETEGRLGNRSRRADLLRNREFELKEASVEPKLWFQPGVRWRAGLSFNYTERLNQAFESAGIVQEGGEMAQMFQPAAEVKWNDPGKGSVELRLRYIYNVFDGPEQSPLQFEMLESLVPGSNFTWGLTVLRSLGDNLQLTVQYEGRQSPGNPTVHLATAQLRAFF